MKTQHTGGYIYNGVGIHHISRNAQNIKSCSVGGYKLPQIVYAKVSELVVVSFISSNHSLLKVSSKVGVVHMPANSWQLCTT